MKKEVSWLMVSFVGTMVYLLVLPLVPRGLWLALPVLFFAPQIYRLLKVDIMAIIWRLRAKFTRVKVTDEALEEFMSRK